MKTVVRYTFGGMSGSLPGLSMGAVLTARTYEQLPFLPTVGSAVRLSYGDGEEDSAMFVVKAITPDLSKTDRDEFGVLVTL